MTLNFDIHPEVRAEFFAGVDWDHERGVSVGALLESGVREAIDAAVESPVFFPSFQPDDRQGRTQVSGSEPIGSGPS